MSHFGRQLFVSGMTALLMVAGCGPKDIKAPERSSSCVSSEKTPSPSTIGSEVRPNVVQVVGDDSILGSGFIIPSRDADNVLIVTSYHVIVESRDLELSFVREGGERLRIAGVSVVRVSPKDDLALLKAPRLVALGRGLKFSPTLQMGQSVVSLGYPYIPGGKTAPVLSSGLVTQTENQFDNRSYIQSNIDVTAGNSGGAAVDTCGRVVGVVAAHHSKLNNVGLLVPVSRVEALYASYNTPRPAPDDEIAAKIKEFAQFLQRDDGQVASSYFARAFLASKVYPFLNDAIKSVETKQKRWQYVQTALRRLGVDPDELTQEQYDAFATKLGFALTPEELYAWQSVEQSRKQGLDAYAMLQAYLGPLLNYVFGQVDDVEVKDIQVRGEVRVAHVVFKGPSGRAHYNMTFVDDMGSYEISDLAAVNRTGSGEQASTTGHYQAQAAQQGPTWVTAARAIRE